MTMRIKNYELGVSLIELVLVLATVAFLALLVNSLPSAISSVNRSRHASLARDIASKEVDYLRKKTYGNLSNGTGSFSDSSLSSLPSPSAVYDVEDCPLDLCPNQEKAKKVDVKVSWRESGDNKSVELTTLVGEGGIGQ